MVFDNPPSDFQAKVEVAACFLEVDDKALFLLRSPHSSQPNTWAIPGGKIENGETPAKAIQREMIEETGLHLPDMVPMKTVYIRYPNLDYVYHMFRAKLETIPPIQLRPREATRYAWFTRKETDALHARDELILDEMPCIERVYGTGAFGA